MTGVGAAAVATWVPPLGRDDGVALMASAHPVMADSIIPESVIRPGAWQEVWITKIGPNEWIVTDVTDSKLELTL